MNIIAIDNKKIGINQPVFIIAEAGVNHNGDLEMAKQLIDVAAKAGADAIKFQSFKAERVASVLAPKADYQKETSDPYQSQLEMIKNLELSPEEHEQLQLYSRQQGILFLSSPFDEESVDLLNHMRIPIFKIASGEVTNWSFLEYVARKNKPLILSTGMSFLSEVEQAVRVIRQAGCEHLILLHCVSSYPAAPDCTNLRAMKTMATAFQLPVGYSDHTPGIEVALAAVALGACVIEKHFTLDKNLPGPDHKASLDPDELQALVAGIRTVEQALGNGIKQPVSSEEENRIIGRRSLATAATISKGTILKPELVTALRPATGISPVEIDRLIGRKVKQNMPQGSLISWSDLE